MANKANAPRKAAIELLLNQIDGLFLTAGMVVKATRGYTPEGEQTSKRQSDVVAALGNRILQPALSSFENGKVIPGAAVLPDVLEQCGFQRNARGFNALVQLLSFLRDHSEALEHLNDEAPQ